MKPQATREIEGIEIPPAGIWEIDRVHSDVAFVARHLVVTKVRGHFGEFSGSLNISDEPEDSSVEVTIKAASIDTNAEDRDNHLRSPDFLDVETYPELTFKSNSMELRGGNRFAVTGDLTIRDVTRPVTLDVEYQGLIRSSQMGDRAGFSATTELDREDWGVTWNMALEAGGWLVSQRVRIEIEIEAVYKGDQA
ncbi:MAG: YceI family protein [Actinobacteria bacterium]|nr:YceI family protein [Actinomycetota bacterium]